MKGLTQGPPIDGDETDGPRSKAARLVQASGGGGAFPAVRRSRFADQAYAFLFHKIVTGEFREGQKLPAENDMCAMFGISRPVVREALDRLKTEGLVTSRRGLGSFVQPRAPGRTTLLDVRKQREFEDNLELRRLIEPQAVVLAAERRTAKDIKALTDVIGQYEQFAVRGGESGAHLDFSFHLAIAQATHNRRIVEAIRAVEYDIGHGVNLMRYMARFDHLERSRNVQAEHRRILEAIESQDPEEAERAMLDHLEQARVRMAKRDPGA